MLPPVPLCDALTFAQPHGRGQKRHAWTSLSSSSACNVCKATEATAGLPAVRNFTAACACCDAPFAAALVSASSSCISSSELADAGLACCSEAEISVSEGTALLSSVRQIICAPSIDLLGNSLLVPAVSDPFLAVPSELTSAAALGGWRS